MNRTTADIKRIEMIDKKVGRALGLFASKSVIMVIAFNMWSLKEEISIRLYRVLCQIKEGFDHDSNI